MGVTGTRATAELSRVMARVLTALRVTQFAYLAYFVAVYSSWYNEDLVRWLGPGAMAAWIVAFGVLAARRGLTTGLVAAEVLLAVTAGAATFVLTPPNSRGDGASWVFVGIVTAAVVVAFRATRAWFVVSLVALVVANYGGASTHRPQVVASTALLVAVAVLGWLTYGRLSGVAFAADTWLAATFDRRTAEAAAAARASDAREQERLIHDTVLNTLTAIGWGGLPDAAVVRSKCARSVAAAAGLLAGTGPRTDVNLAAAVRRSVEMARETGIEVELSVRDRRTDKPATTVRRRLASAARRVAYLAGIYARPVEGAVAGSSASRPSGPSGPSGPSRPPGVPAEVVTALAAAVGEALANVGRHAGTGLARVVVDVRTGRAVVTVSDEGVGFDVEAAGDTRLGLRESVVGRVADVGGWVDVRSTPGRGTAVRLHWSAPDTAPFGQVDAASLQDDYDAAVRRASGTIILAMPLLALSPLLGYMGLVRSPVFAAGLWLASAAVAGVLFRVAVRRPLNRREAVGVVAFGLGAMVACGLNVTDPRDAVRIVNWPIVLGLPVLTTLVVVSRPTKEWISACVAQTVVVLAVGLGVAGTEPLELTRTAAALYALWAVQFLAAAFGPVLCATASTTSLAAASDVELASRQQAAAMIRQDRLARVRGLEAQFLPLLRAVADARVDPNDPVVRRQCANRAGVLRRLLASTAGGTASGLAELERPVEAAEARGVTVDVRLHGDVRGLPTPVRERMAATVAEALTTVVTGTVTLTVLCSAGEGTVYVTFPLPFEASSVEASSVEECPSTPRSSSPALRLANDPGVRVSADVADGIACVEMRWESPAA